MANYETGEAGVGGDGIEVMQQMFGSEREAVGQKSFWMIIGFQNSFMKRIFIAAFVGCGQAEDGVFGEEGEDFSGHVSVEGLDFAVLDLCPFGVSSGEAYEAFKIGLLGQETGDLGFFATHDVGGIFLTDTGVNVDFDLGGFGGDLGEGSLG